MTAEHVGKYFPQNEYDQALQKNKPVGSVIQLNFVWVRQSLCLVVFDLIDIV